MRGFNLFGKVSDRQDSRLASVATLCQRTKDQAYANREVDQSPCPAIDSHEAIGGYPWVWIRGKIGVQLDYGSDFEHTDLPFFLSGARLTSPQEGFVLICAVLTDEVRRLVCGKCENSRLDAGALSAP